MLYTKDPCPTPNFPLPHALLNQWFSHTRMISEMVILTTLIFIIFITFTVRV